MNRPHWEVVRAAVVDGELLCEVVQGIKAVAGVKALLVLPVASFHLAVVTWGYRDGSVYAGCLTQQQ